MIDAIVPNLTKIAETRSSQIAAMGYADDLLYILFRSGGLYVYDKVTVEEWDKLCDLDRTLTGTFVAHIKGKKPYRKLSDGVTELQKLQKQAPADAKPISLALVPNGKKGKPDTEETQSTVEVMAVEAQHFSNEVVAYPISDVKSHEVAQKLLLEIAGRRQRVVQFFKLHKANAYKAWKDLCDDERRILEPLEHADDTLRRRSGEYTYQQLQAARAEDERKRRIAEEDALKRQRTETEDNALAAAEELAAMGDHEAAEAVLENPCPQRFATTCRCRCSLPWPRWTAWAVDWATRSPSPISGRCRVSISSSTWRRLRPRSAGGPRRRRAASRFPV